MQLEPTNEQRQKEFEQSVRNSLELGLEEARRLARSIGLDIDSAIKLTVKALRQTQADPQTLAAAFQQWQTKFAADAGLPIGNGE